MDDPITITVTEFGVVFEMDTAGVAVFMSHASARELLGEALWQIVAVERAREERQE